MADKKSWRDIDRKRDQSAHRREAPTGGRAPRVESATAAYKRSLDAFFDRGVVPDHLKDKLPAGTDGGPSERQKLIREIRAAKTGKDVEKALDRLIADFGMPDDMEILLRALEHSKDAVLAEVLAKIETYVDSGQQVPKKKLFAERLKGLEFTSFDPRVQRRAAALAARLR
ncbi:MAG: hypothetical protein KC620_23155 [Myxococcales bacterium]|nr:hypothetical protein [Myxococcales bacterium]